MADIWRSFVSRRRRRAIAGIMEYVEKQPWWKTLPDASKRALRDKVLGSVNEYHDVVLDLLRTLDENSIGNPEVVRLLDLVHGSQRRMEADARAQAPDGGL